MVQLNVGRKMSRNKKILQIKKLRSNLKFSTKFIHAQNSNLNVTETIQKSFICKIFNEHVETIPQ